MIGIKKIIFATLSWMAIYPKQLLTTSIVPIVMMLPFLLALPSLIDSMLLTQKQGVIPDIEPISTLFFMAMAFIGYALLTINIYRLVILGVDKVGKFGTIRPQKMLPFLSTLIMVQILLVIPILVTKIPIFHIIAYFLLVPVIINLPRLALGLDKKKFKFIPSILINITIIQAVIPLAVVFIITWLISGGIVGVIIIVLVKILMAYAEIISLALIYKTLAPDETTTSNSGFSD